MAEVNDETKNQYAREEKFLGCPPVDLLDDIINSVEDYVCDGLDTLEKTIVQEAGLKDKRAEVGQALDGVMEKLDRSIAKNFDKFELYSLQNILLVPSDIQLPDELPPQSPEGVCKYSAEEEEELDASLHQLRHKLQAAYMINKTMKKEIAEVESDLTLYTQVASSLPVSLPSSSSPAETTESSSTAAPMAVAAQASSPEEKGQGKETQTTAESDSILTNEENTAMDIDSTSAAQTTTAAPASAAASSTDTISKLQFSSDSPDLLHNLQSIVTEASTLRSSTHHLTTLLPETMACNTNTGEAASDTSNTSNTGSNHSNNVHNPDSRSSRSRSSNSIQKVQQSIPINVADAAAFSASL